MALQTSPCPTILIVDDLPGELKALVVFLENLGFRIAVARSGEAAIKQMQYILPDLILLDVLMPGLDGFETCRQLKASETTRKIPIIFMTALTETVDKIKGFEVGGVDYLTKPVNHAEVLARVNAHLTIARLQHQLAQENERFQRLANATFEGILIYDTEQILDANQAAGQMFGCQAEEAIGKPLLELLTPESRQTIEAELDQRDLYPCEAEGLRKDGSSFPIEIQTKTIPWTTGEVRVAAVRDLTWRKTLEHEHAQLQKELTTLRSGLRERYRFGDLIGKSAVMQVVYEAISKAAASSANVLICGESGTGKELAARTIHDLSERKDRNFVPVNCGAVPEALFEREFFGHRKGAFTGATTDQPGYLDRAHGGTLFLDEIGELSPALQVKLLRALQDGEYTPLGAARSKTADVRILAATNKDLKVLLQEGKIREDFFYRIRVMVITLPPLRDRQEDIPLLVEDFLNLYDAPKSLILPEQIMHALREYAWPGNVRELQNELQRYLSTGRLEFLEQTPPPQSAQRRALETIEPDIQDFYAAVERLERQLICNALEQTHGHREQAAALLKILPRTLHRKMQKYGLFE